MQHRIVSREDWVAARKSFLKKEKELTRLRDRLSAELRELPWVRIDKTYVFETAAGRRTLAELFGDNSQLIVQHFMYAPEWEEGCVGCSFAIDHINAAYPHIRHHDVSYVAIARAPVDKLEAYRRRMGWDIPVASSGDSDFNYDFNVSYRPEALASGRVIYNFEEMETNEASIADLPGASVFYKDEAGGIFHTYSSFGRGGEEVISAYMLLDATPKGRNETGPNGNLTDWVRRHDEYESATRAAPCHGTAAE
ncbi:thioredoxin family protein [Microbaculum marinum]|uniref:Thioredoxin family protein n=1 Tax=Microbaculum marinum TaxID=1764581 RepID=A0AAW9RQ77_9HYPH